MKCRLKACDLLFDAGCVVVCLDDDALAVVVVGRIDQLIVERVQKSQFLLDALYCASQ